LRRHRTSTRNSLAISGNHILEALDRAVRAPNTGLCDFSAYLGAEHRQRTGLRQLPPRSPARSAEILVCLKHLKTRLIGILCSVKKFVKQIEQPNETLCRVFALVPTTFRGIPSPIASQRAVECSPIFERQNRDTQIPRENGARIPIDRVIFRQEHLSEPPRRRCGLAEVATIHMPSRPTTAR